MACGWSPAGANSDKSSNRRPPSDFSGRGGRWGTKSVASGTSFRLVRIAIAMATV